MIWATVAQVRSYWAAQLAAYGSAWAPALPADDGAVQTLIDSAARRLTRVILRWPVLDDTDRAEDTVQRAHIVAAVAETVRGRLRGAAEDAAVGGMAAVIAAGGSISADNLSVSGGRGALIGETRTLSCDAVDALAAADMIGGGVATW